jgi:hypothetical protein
MNLRSVANYGGSTIGTARERAPLWYPNEFWSSI